MRLIPLLICSTLLAQTEFNTLRVIPNANRSAAAEIVSAAHPMELYCHFTDTDKTHIRFSYSRDYLNYMPVNLGGYGPYTENRDPSCYDDGTTIYIVASPTPAANSLAQFWTTTDLVTILGPTTIDMKAVLPGTNADYAPEWFIDPNSSFIGIVQALSTNGAAPVNIFTPYLSEIILATLSACTTAGAATCPAALGNSTRLALTGTAQSFVFDFWLNWDAPSGKYFLFYVDEYTATGFPYYQQIAYATSPALTGAYTQVTVPTSPTSSDHFAFSKTSEGMAVVPLANSITSYGTAGCYRVYADTWVNLSNNENPRLYLWQYVDTCPAFVGGDPFATVKNPPIPVNIARSEHGTVITVRNQARANMIFDAAAYWKNGTIAKDR